MGETKYNDKKLSLMDFLYKDEYLIRSLYSQYFGGDLDLISKTETNSNNTLKEKGLDIKAFNGKKQQKSDTSESLSKNIIPRDAKILDLFSELNIKEYDKSLTACNNGRLIKLEGDLFFRNFDRLKNIIPLLPKIPNFSNIGFPTFKKDQDIKILINYLSDIIPSGIELEILTRKGEQMICNINKDFLMTSLDNISKVYNGNYLGSWTIIGIFDNNNSKKMTELKAGSFRKIMDDFENTIIKSFFNDEQTSFVLKPILIYRTISY